MDYLFIGIDISKDHLDYAYCLGSDKKVIDVSRVENSVAGIKKLLKQIKKLSATHELWVCFEHTGNYGLLLAHMLQEAEVVYSMVSSMEIIKSIGMTRGKSDPIDAGRIALYAAIHSHKLSPAMLESASILKIKTLLTMRDQLVKIRTQLKNAVKAILLNHQLLDFSEEIALYDAEIAGYDKKVANIEKRIIEILKADECLNKNYQKLIRITGMGLITSAALIVVTNNFTAFDNPRKFNCYSGLAPFEYSSGSSIKRKTRTSQYRNKTMKKLLFNVALVAIIHDPQIRAYFKRKSAEGKHRMSIINAVACKMVYRAFAVIKREEPYVDFSMKFS